jgi:hypothetical protein
VNPPARKHVTQLDVYVTLNLFDVPKTKHLVGLIDLELGPQLSGDPTTSEGAKSLMIAFSVHFEEDCVW